MTSVRALLPASLRLPHYIFAAVLVLRSVVLLRLTASPFLLPTRGDMHFYNEWALRILRGEWTDGAAFYGLPGYAYLLAALYSVTGVTPFVPAFLQGVLDAGTATLVYLIAEKIFAGTKLATNRFARGQAVGFIAALGWAFFVPAQTYSVVLMPTSWLVFTFWLVVWILVRKHEAPRPTLTFAIGLLLGLVATGIATILFLFPLLLSAIVLLPSRLRENALRQRLLAVSMACAGVLIGTSPCWIHNHFIAGDPVALSAHSGINFWIGNNPQANGYPRFPPGLRAGQAAMLQDSLDAAEAAAGRKLKRSEVSSYWSAKAGDYIRNSASHFLRLLGLKLRNFWSAFQYDDLSIITSFRQAGVTLPGPSFGLIAVLAVPGILLSLPRCRRSGWVLAAILLHMVSLLTVFVTERYRLAAVPGLMMFATAGLWFLWRALLTAAWKRITTYAVALCAACLAFAQSPRDPALWALDAYNSGWQALASGDLARAEESLNLALAYIPENPETNFALGNLRLEQKRLKEARQFYLRTIELDSRHKGAFNNLGVIALEEERWDEAARLFLRATKLDPTEAKTFFLLARAYLGANDLDAASVSLAQARELRNQAQFDQLLEEIASRREAASGRQ